MFSAVRKVSSQSGTYNLGLRKYFLGVYNYMTTGIAVTALVSYFFAKTGLTLLLLKGPIGIVFTFLPLVLVFTFSMKIKSLSSTSAKLLFFLYSASVGISISSIFFGFRAEDIFKSFLIASSLFGSMSLYGYITEKDLSKFSSLFTMAIVGLLIASLVNLFTRSSMLSFLLSFAAVIIFTALVAFDTQNIKRVYYQIQEEDSETVSKVAVFGALQLYMDFLNIFLNLLYLFGASRGGNDDR